MKTIISIVISLAVFSSSWAFAQEQAQLTGKKENVSETSANSSYEVPLLVIIANRIPTELENVGRSIESRDQKDIKDIRAITFSQTLSTVSGVRVNDVGGPSAPGLAPLEIRGFRSGGGKLLLNGMTLDDPSSVSGNFDAFYSNLDTLDTKRVEVLKGGAGVLYGSDAQAGAINLITVRPEQGLSSDLALEGGAYNTFREGAVLNGASETTGAIAAVSRFDTDGMHSHSNAANTNILLSGEHAVIDDRLTVSAIIRIIEAQNDLDTSPALDSNGALITNLPTEKNNVDSSAYFYGIVGNYRYSEDVTSTAKVYFNQAKRDYLFDFSGFESMSNYEGNSLHVEEQNSRKIDYLNSELVWGMDFVHQEVDTLADTVSDQAQRDLTGFYLNNRAFLLDDSLQISGGARATIVSDINKTVPTVEGSLVYKLDDLGTRLHSSIAQGFRAPTLFESRGHMQDYNTGEIVSVGNSNLKEEESLSWDIGLEQRILKNTFTADLTFFQIDSDQTILFDYANFTHENGGGGKTQGVEVSVHYQPTGWFYSRWASTYLDKADGLDGERRQRTPRNWFSWTSVVSYEQFSLAGILRYRGQQELAFFGVTDTFKEADITLVDLVLSYKIDNNIDLYIKGQNIFNVEYTEAGYDMPDASYYVGATFCFM